MGRRVGRPEDGTTVATTVVLGTDERNAVGAGESRWITPLGRAVELAGVRVTNGLVE